MFEYKDDIITNLIVCPICKQLIEVGSKPYPWDGGIDNVQLMNFDEYEVDDDESTDSPVV